MGLALFGRSSQSKNGLAGDRLARCFRQVILAQAGLALMVVVVLLLSVSLRAALSSSLGVALAMVNTWVTRRSIQKSSALAYAQPELSMAPVFTGLVQRLALFAGGMLAGITILHLLPLYILIGFIILQLGYLACRMT